MYIYMYSVNVRIQQYCKHRLFLHFESFLENRLSVDREHTSGIIRNVTRTEVIVKKDLAAVAQH